LSENRFEGHDTPPATRGHATRDACRSKLVQYQLLVEIRLTTSATTSHYTR
jgi:hypothetical protein